MAFSHVEGLDVATVTPAAWTPPGLPDGITIQVMGEDPDTGAVTAVLDLPAGWSSSAPVACAAEQELFVLGGVLVQGQATMRGGGYSAHPAGEGQGGWHSPEGCRMIARYTAAPSFTPSRAGTGAVHPLTVEAVDSWALPWIDPLAASAPSEEFRTGVMVKLLRRNDETGASTHMAGLMPGWFMTGQEVHPVIEENYCLSGDVHVADVAGKPGYTMTPGVYLARPAGVAHGPIVSKNGNVNLVFAHGFLGIDYVVHSDADALIAAHLDQFPWV